MSIGVATRKGLFRAAWRYAALILLCSVIAEAGAGAGEVAGDAAGTGSARHEFGRKVYNFRCYFCHGYSGDGKTVASRFLTPPPRDFTSLSVGAVPRDSMIESVTLGRAGTAMQGFGRTLTADEIEAVVDFVRQEFIASRLPNTHYHTIANGWPDHEPRYGAACAVATPRDRR